MYTRRQWYEDWDSSLYFHPGLARRLFNPPDYYRSKIGTEEANRQVEAIMNAKDVSDKMIKLVGEDAVAKYQAKLIDNIIESI